MTAVHQYWNDAKLTAKNSSMTEGFAWIVEVSANAGFSRGKSGGFQVISGESTEDAPVQYSAEFKDGVEQ